MPKNTKQEWIVVLSTYPPRECGIATFAASLVKALNTQLPRNIRAKVVAINKSASHHYIYPNEVVDQVIESDKADFIRVAKSLTVNPRVKAVIVQHEFGIYGKHAGAVLVDFLRHLNKPVLTVLHTVEQRPRPEYKQVLQQIAAQSHALITMNHTATHLLADVYGIQDGPSIHVIPHGIPEILPYDRFAAKKRLQLGGKDVLITFGLLSPDKSVDTVIRALPGIVKKFPKATYVIVGQTHPNIVARDGEVYRKSLERLVTKLHMDAHVKFVNHYMSEQDILQYLSAADLYVLSPRNPNQIVSGTLAYAMGAGKAVVSTPFLHAKEMAQHGLIHLANFESPASFRKEI
jgi:glycosyltransferase involved in cell wall biosynthesis